MEDLSSSQQNFQPPMGEQPLPKKRKIGLFGLLYVIGAAIVLLFLVLNYFNILKLSEIFPNYLGFLPHKEQVNPTIPQPTQTQDNYSPNIFQYDTEKAKTTLTNYIKKTIKPEFLPVNLEIKEGLSIDNIVEVNKRQFGSYFTVSQATFSINFHYKENTNAPNDFIIFIQPSKVDETTVAQGLASSLTNIYFNNPFPITNCDIKGTTSYCEEFKTESNGKRGFGAIIAQDPSKSPPQLTTIVFTCFIPKESKDYDGMKSCISL